MKMVLGTVAFGIDGYSLPNTGKPKPTLDSILKMLDYARSNGIEFLDTADAYGDAEERIAIYGADKFKVISKLKPNCLEGVQDREVLPIIKSELQTDLSRLGIPSLWGYYFHTPEYLYNKKAVEALIECKKEGLVENIGVSIYEPKDACYAVKQNIDIIQVPYNILDQRLHKTDFFSISKENKVKVFARSPFLKGLLTMPIDKLPQHLESAKPHMEQIDGIVSKHNCQRIEACMLFSLMNPNIDYVVFGVESLDQLQFNMGINSSIIGAIQNWGVVSKFGKCYEELRTTFQDIPYYIIMPSLWSKK